MARHENSYSLERKFFLLIFLNVQEFRMEVIFHYCVDVWWIRIPKFSILRGKHFRYCTTDVSLVSNWNSIFLVSILLLGLTVSETCISGLYFSYIYRQLLKFFYFLAVSIYISFRFWKLSEIVFQLIILKIRNKNIARCLEENRDKKKFILKRKNAIF